MLAESMLKKAIPPFLFAAVIYVYIFMTPQKETIQSHSALMLRGISTITSGIKPDSESKSIAGTSTTDSDHNSNYAPQLEIDSTACKKGKMMGLGDSGGWNICLDYLLQYNASRGCTVYSYGLGADWSFDKAMEAQGCIIHGFDPSGRNWREGMYGRDYRNIDYAKQYPSEHRKFHAWGLGAVDVAVYPPGTIPQEWPGLGDPPFSSSNSDKWVTKSVRQTMRDLGHASVISKWSSSEGSSSRSTSNDYGDEEWHFKELSVLKVDVEGAEWDALTGMVYQMGPELQRGLIPQLLVEWHWDPDTRLKNTRHQQLLQKIYDIGYRAWSIATHKGSECCLDVRCPLAEIKFYDICDDNDLLCFHSYVWVGNNLVN